MNDSSLNSRKDRAAILSVVKTIGPSGIRNLALKLGTSKNQAPFSHLLQSIPPTSEAISKAAVLLEEWERNGIFFCSYLNKEYPYSFRALTAPPPFFFCRGNVRLLNDSMPRIAIVGSRKSSLSGSRHSFSFARELGSNGICIVSGLALGIDTAAHEGALDAGGATIAVLGSGLLSLYPRRNLGLAERIVERDGLLISQFEPTVTPRPEQFLMRNYLVAGLCSGGLVVQAAKRSGALHTARVLIEEGREVYAVPGDIDDPLAAGTNALIQAGAIPAVVPEDILENLSVSGGGALLSG